MPSDLSLLSSSVILTDESLKITALNPAAENLFGIARRHWLGKNLSTLFGEIPELKKAIDHALGEGWSYTCYAMNVTRASGMLTLDCAVTPVRQKDSRLLFECWPVATRQKIAREERLRQQQWINREMIRNLAHEIRNPLGGIRGAAQLLSAELKDESLREYTNVIIEETDRLQNLMSRLLPSKKGIPFTPVNIHEVLERVEFLLTNEFPEIQIVCDFDPSLPEIQGDAEGLIQAVLNIARNAAQALEEKGEIILKSRVARNLVWNRRHHRLALELQIIDHGPGIPEELLEHVFYPLVSGKSEGSGLGLSIAQNVIERHEGSIIVESGEGRTCFTIDLPLKSKV